MKKTLLLLVQGFALCLPLAAAIYVAPDGNDLLNQGTFEKPFKTLAKAVSAMQPGDTVFVRGGSYSMTANLSIGSSKNGTDTARIHLYAYPGERPVLDFSSTSMGVRGITLKASWWHIKGFDVRGAGDNGMYISGGSNNIIELCSFFENRDTGLQLSGGASNNQIINCDSYFNADPTDYGDADGFAPKLSCGSGNAFYGCRAWGNCDDGWDGYLRESAEISTMLENCWTWGNGYLKDGTDPGSQANGNGFKMGGGDNSNSEQLMHHVFLKNCMAFGNKGKGFDQNNNAGSMTLLNCTAYGNRGSNYSISRALAAGQAAEVKNGVSFNGSVSLGGFVVQQTNSWLSPFVTTADDFLSHDTTGVSAPRRTDGSLPDIPFMRLASGSDLIDAGTDVHLPYLGVAPDLGAFESPYTTSVVQSGGAGPSGFRLDQNYPNPFNSTTVIRFNVTNGADIRLTIHDASGRRVRTLVSERMLPGNHEIAWNGRDDSGRMLATGIYLVRLAGGGHCESRRMLMLK